LKIWLPTIKTNTGSDVFTLRLAEGLEQNGISVTITWFPHYFEFMPKLLSGFMPPEGTEIIHTNSWSGFAFRKPGVVHVTNVHHCVHDNVCDKYKSYLQKIYHKYLIYHYEALSIQCADSVVSVSKHTASQVEKIFTHLNIKNPVFIYNGIDTELFSKKKNRKHEAGKFRILFAGNNSNRKGFYLLPGIMDKLGDGFILYYTGEPRNKKTTRHNNMHSLGRLDNGALLNAYQDCDVVIVPSLYEGFGYAACEAMACAKPVVASDNSSLPEIIVDGKTGILCSTHDVGSFCDALRTLANNPGLRNSMGESGRAHVMSNFTLDKMSKSYIAHYKELLNGRS